MLCCRRRDHPYQCWSSEGTRDVHHFKVRHLESCFIAGCLNWKHFVSIILPVPKILKHKEPTGVGDSTVASNPSE